jgi:aspartyl-tRNA(Asn)/glutamyl-tRNA(Gln) amidotransferase subunit A
VIRALKGRGATVVPVSLPNTSYALSAYYIIASAEASSNLARYDGVQYGLHVPLPLDSIAGSPGEVYAHSRTAGFGAEVKRRILLGTYALTAEYELLPTHFFLFF